MRFWRSLDHDSVRTSKPASRPPWMFVAPPGEELPTVTYGVTEADLAAEEAETTAEDAQAAEAAEPAPEAPKSELALAGLY